MSGRYRNAIDRRHWCRCSWYHYIAPYQRNWNPTIWTNVHLSGSLPSICLFCFPWSRHGHSRTSTTPYCSSAPSLRKYLHCIDASTGSAINISWFDPCCSDDSVALMSCSDRPPTEIPTDAHSVQSPPERQIAQHWYNYYQSHPKGHQNNHWQIPYVRIPPSRQRMPADYSNPGLFSVKSWRKPTLPLSHPYGQTSVPFWSLPRLLRSQNEHPR